MATKLLLVEDDASLAQMYQTLLTGHGYDVKHCGDGERALAMAVEFKPNLILLDIMMPKLSGFDVLDILRNTPDTVNTKIIMLTALDGPLDRKKAFERGANDYLVKPEVSTAEVIKKIQDLLAG
ncbi:MAG: response regulator [Candidatus Saccharibacteria bacterium]